MRNIFLTLFVLTILSSCVTQERCNKKFPTKDSTYTLIDRHDSIVYKHDTVPVPYQELIFADDSPCPPAVFYNKKVRSNGLTATVTIKDGKLTAKCEADSLKMVIESKDTFIFTLKKLVTEKEKQIAVRDGWYYFFKSGFWICLGLVLLTILGLIYVK